MSNELANYEGSSSRELATSETASTAVAAQSRALIESRYVMAKKFPRDEEEVRQKLLKECLRPSFASVAIYRKPIGQGIEGPSIRFAETAIRLMKNIVIDTMTVYDDREKRIVRVMVTDLEANVPYSQDVTVEKTVERRNVKQGDEVLRSRTNKQGHTVHIIVGTDDDILNKQNALISKAIRTQGLRLVPGDLIDEALELIYQTRQNQDAADPDKARRNVFDAFNHLGVPVTDLQAWLGHKGDSLTPKELSDLRGLYAALKDGETSWREIMDAKAGKTEDAGESIKGKPLTDALKATEKKKEAAQESPKDDPVGAIYEAMQNAVDEDALNEAWDRTRMLDPQPSKKVLGEINAYYTKRLKELSE